MSPLSFNRIEPGTFGGQEARQDAHPQPGLCDRLVVATDPGANGLAFVPGGIVPDQNQCCFSLCRQMGDARGEKIDGYGADGTTIDKAQKHLVGPPIAATHQQAVASQCFGIMILFVSFEFLQPSQSVFLHPATLFRLSETTPPDLIFKGQCPCWMGHSQTDQAISPFFFLR